MLIRVKSKADPSVRTEVDEAWLDRWPEDFEPLTAEELDAEAREEAETIARLDAERAAAQAPQEQPAAVQSPAADPAPAEQPAAPAPARGRF